METHKGPPYISFVHLGGFFILTALETHKGPPYIFTLLFYALNKKMKFKQFLSLMSGNEKKGTFTTL
jgi:hypothetical protein